MATARSYVATPYHRRLCKNGECQLHICSTFRAIIARSSTRARASAHKRRTTEPPSHHHRRRYTTQVFIDFTASRNAQPWHDGLTSKRPTDGRRGRTLHTNVRRFRMVCGEKVSSYAYAMCRVCVCVCECAVDDNNVADADVCIERALSDSCSGPAGPHKSTCGSESSSDAWHPRSATPSIYMHSGTERF